MFFIIWIVLCFAIAAAGEGRKIGFWGAFFLSLFLSPIIGAIFTFTSDRKQDEYFRQQVVDSSRNQERSINEIKENLGKISKADEIKQLKGLLDEGIISQEDFEKGKHNILSRTE